MSTSHLYGYAIAKAAELVRGDQLLKLEQLVHGQDRVSALRVTNLVQELHEKQIDDAVKLRELANALLQQETNL